MPFEGAGGYLLDARILGDEKPLKNPAAVHRCDISVRDAKHPKQLVPYYPLRVLRTRFLTATVMIVQRPTIQVLFEGWG